MHLFLDPQLHWVARIVNERNDPANIDRDIRFMHDKYMLVSDQHFNAFAHDVRALCEFERSRALDVRSFQVISAAGLKIDSVLGRVWDDRPDGLPA